MKKIWIGLALAAVLCTQPLAGAVAGAWFAPVYLAEAADEAGVGLYKPGVRVPTAPGDVSYSAGGAVIDATNTASGYVMVKYSGDAAKLKARVTTPRGTTYTYSLRPGSGYQAFPLTGGDGSYTVEVYENVSGDQYALTLGKTLSVTLGDAFLPYLYANQYIWFDSSTTVVRQASSLAANVTDELGLVQAVYDYTMQALSYDFDMANAVIAGTVKAGYTPALNSVAASGKGICFDYAAVMTAMLRSQGVPTRLEVGYAGQTYHAWVSVYTQSKGWINGIIQFNGNTWSLMDPTSADTGGDSATSFITNPANYKLVYMY